jgi:hypothetical protein
VPCLSISLFLVFPLPSVIRAVCLQTFVSLVPSLSSLSVSLSPFIAFCASFWISTSHRPCRIPPQETADPFPSSQMCAITLQMWCPIAVACCGDPLIDRLGGKPWPRLLMVLRYHSGAAQPIRLGPRPSHAGFLVFTDGATSVIFEKSGLWTPLRLTCSEYCVVRFSKPP